MSEPGVLRQYGPYPQALADLVGRLRYRPGWTFALSDMERDPADTHGAAAGGLTLVIFADVHDTYAPDWRRPVHHYFPVPAATYNGGSWLRWLLDCVLLVERHEACEWFRLGEAVTAERPFARTHGPGENPYVVKELATDEARRTSFRGVKAAGPPKAKARELGTGELGAWKPEFVRAVDALREMDWAGFDPTSLDDLAEVAEAVASAVHPPGDFAAVLPPSRD